MNNRINTHISSKSSFSGFIKLSLTTDNGPPYSTASITVKTFPLDALNIILTNLSASVFLITPAMLSNENLKLGY